MRWTEWRLASRARIVTISGMTRNVPDVKSGVGNLVQRALIRMEGADAERLLQGQLSNDVAALAIGQQQFTSLNSPKGRMLATGFLMRVAPETWWFDLPQSLAESANRRLKMFVLRSDVRIEVMEAATAIGVIGIPPADALPAQLHEVVAPLLDPQAPITTGHLLTDGRLAMPRPGHPRRVVIWSPDGPPSEGQDLSDAWRLADIQAGIPNLAPETQDRFIAQHAGVDRLDGISFTKGCFTGQEVIARLHYLGQAKRFLVRGTSALAPMPGQRVMRADDDGTAGEVIDAVVISGQGHWLAVVQGSTFAAGDLHLAPDQPATSLDYFVPPAVNDS